ncbi:MAG: hypothetical protein HPY58_11065 [Firmicutes bacterium]|nr:hypothetical protein [Bacillota bacterium]
MELTFFSGKIIWLRGRLGGKVHPASGKEFGFSALTAGIEERKEKKYKHKFN